MPIEYPSWLTWGYKPPPEAYSPETSIKTGNEFRARLDAANLFFRSKDTGEAANQIWVRIELGGSMPVGTGDQNPGPGELITLIVGRGTLELERHYGRQNAIASTEPGPTDAEGNPTTVPITIYDPHGPTTLRAKVNANSAVITMPERNFDIVDALGTENRTGRTVGRVGPATPPESPKTHVPALAQTFLHGGDGTPVNAVGVKTGVFHALCFVRWSERPSPNGQMNDFNAFLVWRGETADDPQGKWVPLTDQLGGPPPRESGTSLDTNAPWDDVTAAFP